HENLLAQLRALSGGRRLPLDVRDALIEASPARRTRGPDRHGRSCQLRVVKGAGAHEDQVRPRRRTGEQVRPTDRAESAPHRIATVGHRGVLAQLTTYRDGFSREAGIHRGAAGADVLTHAAPADSGDDRGSADRVTYCPAEDAARDVHVACSLERTERKSSSIAEGQRGKGKRTGLNRAQIGACLKMVPVLSMWAAREHVHPVRW